MVKREGSRKTVILGIGNTLMGDEGVGVAVIRELEVRIKDPSIRIVDGGTGGFHLLEFFQEFDRVILVDATADGQPAGTVGMLRPRFSSDYPVTLTAHDIGLKDLLDALYLLDVRPEIVLFTVSIELPKDLNTELTAPIRAAVPTAASAVETWLESGA